MTSATSCPTIHPVMIGTAGHVDHGKTSLVQLLTGCNTDRLREEQERGLTIDLGFAPCRLPGNRLAGIVDVPGHEDFIRNMVAGAASIDVLMLVVAADDGIMPQTREHLLIVKTLRTPNVMVVITKTDLVDAEMHDLVRDDVASHLADSGFPDVPIVLMSNTTANGIGDVRRTLVNLVDSVNRPPDPRAFRMDIERVFSVKGYGTVVTGIPRSGSIRVGDPCTLHPAGSSHTVRALQSYKLDAEEACAHACAAINLRDLSPDVVHRGMTLTAHGTYFPTDHLVAHITNQSREIALKRTTRMTLHGGTTSTNASVRLFDKDSLAPGECCFADIRLAEPLVLSATDRFVLRHQTPVTTVGGGIVLSAETYKLKRSNPYLLSRLHKAHAAALNEDAFATAVLAGSDPLPDTGTLKALSACDLETTAHQISQACEAGLLCKLGSGDWLVSGRAAEMAEHIAARLRRYHGENPYSWGMTPRLAATEYGIDTDSIKPLVKVLRDISEIRYRNDHLALDSFEPALSAKQMEWRDAILTAVRDSETTPPARGDLKESLGIPEKEMKLLLRLLIEEEAVTLVGANLMSPDRISHYRQTVLDLLSHATILDLKAFRDATGLSRNLAVTVLEAFDKEGLTRRVEGGRVLLEPIHGDSQQ